MLDAGPIQEAIRYCHKMRKVGLRFIDQEQLCTIILAIFAQQGALPSHYPKVEREYIEAKFVQEEWISTTICAKLASSCLGFNS